MKIRRPLFNGLIILSAILFLVSVAIWIASSPYGAIYRRTVFRQDSAAAQSRRINATLHWGAVQVEVHDLRVTAPIAATLKPPTSVDRASRAAYRLALQQRQKSEQFKLLVTQMAAEAKQSDSEPHFDYGPVKGDRFPAAGPTRLGFINRTA